MLGVSQNIETMRKKLPPSDYINEGMRRAVGSSSRREKSMTNGKTEWPGVGGLVGLGWGLVGLGWVVELDCSFGSFRAEVA